jgi:hypothetical protein
MFVIGVAGQAQMGKDTLADRLCEKLNAAGGAGVNDDHPAEHLHWTRGAFAANVKKVFCDTFDVDMDFVEKWKVIPEPPPGFDMTVQASPPVHRGRLPQDQDRRSGSILPSARQGHAQDHQRRALRQRVPPRQERGRSGHTGRQARQDQQRSKRVRGADQALRRVVRSNTPRLRACQVLQLEDLPQGQDDDCWAGSATVRRQNTWTQFDAFVRNNGTKEEFFKIIDEQLVSLRQTTYSSSPKRGKRRDNALYQANRQNQVPEAIKDILGILQDPNDTLYIKGEYFGYFVNRMCKRFLATRTTRATPFNSFFFNESKKKTLSSSADSLAACINVATPSPRLAS